VTRRAPLPLGAARRYLGVFAASQPAAARSYRMTTGMPTYEYRCAACAHDFEKFQKMNDEPAAECPMCGAAAQRRLSGGAGLLFKGSGFYITDYRNDSYKKAASADGGSAEKKSGGESKAKAADKPTGSDGGSSGGSAAKSD
jgi:putative FmdB family regulatory protein